ncbi:UrcA family protein [Phenylobacterium montanum]|uniref:UrcA family protein n=1 Tax=Phenylobacterium montanum TaxID=2823693 RepID=A0A975G322_9CAUL|nr:UrcA family protein [Caulobacter sp. S6]QUD89884.1 UrcA family protein [Caulobacter sp. S6]
MIGETRFKILKLAGLAATAALVCGPSMAQQTYYDSNEYTAPDYEQAAPPDETAPPEESAPPPASAAPDDITVYAPRTRERDNGDTVSASRVVYVGDLDLGARWGRHAAKVRIEQTARQVCDQLADDYPNSSDDSGACVPDAVTHAMVQLRDIAYRQDETPPW